MENVIASWFGILPSVHANHQARRKEVNEKALLQKAVFFLTCCCWLRLERKYIYSSNCIFACWWERLVFFRWKANIIWYDWKKQSVQRTWCTDYILNYTHSLQNIHHHCHCQETIGREPYIHRYTIYCMCSPKSVVEATCSIKLRSTVVSQDASVCTHVVNLVLHSSYPQHVHLQDLHFSERTFSVKCPSEREMTWDQSLWWPALGTKKAWDGELLEIGHWLWMHDNEWWRDVADCKLEMASRICEVFH